MDPHTQQPPPEASNLPLTSTTPDTTLSEALQILRKRRWVLLGFFIFGILFGFWRAITQPIIYTATGRIEVRSGSANQYRVDAASSIIDSDTRLQTEVTILGSDSLLASVARQMNLANNPDFLNAPVPAHPRSMDDPEVRQDTVHMLQSNLRIGLVPKTDIISISFVSPHPQIAADIVNHIINGYIQRSYETRFASTQRVSQWLSGQLDDLKQQVETSQEQLIDLQKQLGVLGLGFDASHTETASTSALDALTKAATEARINRIIAESRYRTLANSSPTALASVDSIPGVVSGDVTRMRGDLVALRTKLAQESVTLGPNHPTIQALKNQIAELQRSITAEQNRLVNQAHQALVATETNEAETQKAVENAKNEAYRLRDDLVEYTLRQREYESNRALYEGLLSRLRAAGVQAGLESLEIDIVDQAIQPTRPTIKPRSSIIMLTIIMSVIAGIIISFLLESLDTGLRSVAEVESVTQLPSLAIIPRIRKSSSEVAPGQSVAASNLGVLATSKSQFSEAFRALRTSLLLSTSGHPPKIIQVTSSTPSDGKTTVATNLACILAQRETRVLLIDADLRRPNVHHRFGLSGKTGLSTVLSGISTLEDTVQTIPEVPNLDILPSGPVPPFPTEMLSSESMQHLLETCVGLYTHIVLDSPPILSVTDGVILARLADAVVLVIRHGKANRHVVRRGRDLLVRSGAPMAGTVLNAVDISSPEYYGYYGYSGYAYSNVDHETWEVDNIQNGGKNA
ncbi:MAG: polysaccharide biosynthesis tyrosine autokinase [Acidobacteria bacterium]|nr:polysaccharide biosynthesis tyrosine autokinase [Acidobacteriota bacterium]